MLVGSVQAVTLLRMCTVLRVAVSVMILRTVPLVQEPVVHDTAVPLLHSQAKVAEVVTPVTLAGSDAVIAVCDPAESVGLRSAYCAPAFTADWSCDLLK